MITKRSIISEAPVEEESVGEAPTEEISAETVPVAEAAVTETTTEAAPEQSTNGLEETYGLDYWYLISSYCFDYVHRTKTHPKEKDDIVSYFEEPLKENEVILSRIREFQNTYSDDQAISWFQCEPIFSICLNHSFKCATVEAIYYCRMLIRDLRKQLIQNQCTSPIEVYRSEIMSDEQFEKLKSFNGKIITIKSYFFTNSDRDKALSCSANPNETNGSKRILFIIDANPESNKGQPFAKITSPENNNDENVVFNIGSLFRMTDIEDEKDALIMVKLTFCANDQTNPVQQSCDELILRHTNEQGETDRIRFGEFLVDFGRILSENELFAAGERIIHFCLNKLTNEDAETDRLHCYDALGNIESQRNDLDKSLEWYKKALDLRKEKVSENDLTLVTNYQNLATVTLQKSEFSQAREYFQQIVNILKKSKGDDCLDLIPCYSKLAETYEKEENRTDALVYYYLMLAILTKNRYSDEKTYAAVYYNLGLTCTALKQYQVALGFYSASLELKMKHFPNASSTMAVTYQSIGFLYKAMGIVQQAQTHLEKAAEIYRQLDPPAEANVAQIEEDIRNLLTPNAN